MGIRRAGNFGATAAGRVLTTALAAGLCFACGGGDDGPDGTPNGSGGAGSPPLGSGGTGVGGTQACGTGPVDTGATVLRRLSALEYQLTTQDLLALPEPPDASDLPLDNEHLGFRTFAEYQTMSADNLRAYLDKGSSLAAELFADSARRQSVIGCDTAETDCLSDFVARFGKLAYRRPLEADEILAITDAATELGTDADDRFAFAIEAMLASPNFLYRVEVGSVPEGLSELTEYELASKLSFAVWGRSPSAELLDAAAAGSLDTPDGLRSTAVAMLADDRAKAFFQQFFRQWLRYQTLKPPDASVTEVFADMQTETDRLLEEYAWGTGRFLDVLTANHSYVTPELAAYYGLGEPDADGRVEFDADDPRENSGLLTHASLLSAKSDGDLIAIRGSWLLRTFLCQEVEVPAGLADTIGELLVGLDRVGIVEARNTRSECVSCHSVIDPIGIGFAAFDRSGIFDEEEDPSIFGIDAALPVAPAPNTFTNVSGLSTQLASLPAVPGCLTERAYLYVNGREPTTVDHCGLDGTTQAFTTDQSFRSLLDGLVNDPAFRLRRAPEP